MPAPYPATMVALLGEVARRARSGRLLLDAARGDAGGAVVFHRGVLCAFLPPEGAGADAGAGDVLRFRRSIPAAALDAASRGAKARFDPGDQTGTALEPPLTAADLAIEFGRLIEDAAWLEELLGVSSGCRLVRPTAAPVVMPHASLGPGEGFLLSRADGTLTLRQVLDAAPLGELATLRALYSLESVGLLASAQTARAASAAPEAAAARAGAAPAGGGPDAGRLSALDRFLSKTAPSSGARSARDRQRDDLLARCQSVREQDHYSILGVDKSATESQIRAAYYRLAKAYHPDRLHKPHLEDIRRDLEGMFAAITDAYNTLSHAALRSEYDRDQAERMAGRKKPDAQGKHLLARDSYLRGRKELEAGHMFEALRLFEVAVENDPTRAEYFHHLGVCQGRNPRWRKKAEEALLRAISLSPASARSYQELARVYRKGGLERRALEMYAQLLRWEPDNPEALAALGRGKDAPAPGLLGGLFKKD